MTLTASACVTVSRVGEGPPPAATTAPAAMATPVTTATSVTSASTTSSAPTSSAPVSTPSEASPQPPRTSPRFGYLALDERNLFASSVSAGVRSAAESAGVELIECDPAWSRDGVAACAQQLGDIGIDGLLSFQPFADLAAAVCAATGDVPTVGVVFEQGPCQASRLRIDQAESGRLAGAAVGAFAEGEWDCELSAYLSLESSDADPDGRARMAGYRSGFEEHCPLPGRTFVLDDADSLVTAQTQVAGLLGELRGRRIIVVGLNEDAVLGAMAAASAVRRDDELWYSGQLAEPPIREHIACDEQYIASVAQFPERFGDTLVPILIDAVAGETVPDLVDAPLELVTAANVREVFPDTPACDE